MIGRLVPRYEFEKIAAESERKHHMLSFGYQHPSEIKSGLVGRAVGGPVGGILGTVGGTLAPYLLAKHRGFGPSTVDYLISVPLGLALGTIGGRVVGGQLGKSIGSISAAKRALTEGEM